jgi:hypothetical protein
MIQEQPGVVIPQAVCYFALKTRPKKAEYKKWRMFQSINPWHIVSIEIAIWVTCCKRHYPSVTWGSQSLFKITIPLILYGTR